LHVALVLLVVAVLAFVFGSPANAEKKQGADKKTAGDKAGTGNKEKTYSFGGLDIDGKLKTPQLLYFLNRMKSEFDTTTPDKRSFIPELKSSTNEM
jgi:hypothetical protein